MSDNQPLENHNNTNDDISDGKELSLDSDIYLSGRVGQQLLGKLLLPSISSLKDDSQELMKLFISQAFVDGNINPNLINWVAESFARHVYDNTQSLDVIFNVKPKRGKPLKLTPNKKRSMINAYYDSLRKSKDDEGLENDKKRNAEEAAFFVCHGEEANVVRSRYGENGKGAFDDLMDRVRKVINKFENNRKY